MNPFSVEGRLALVTGATRGIGLGAARALAEAGADVILVGRSEPELEAAADELRTLGHAVYAAPFDLQNVEGIVVWFEDLCTKFGVPDVLVNSAGVSRRGPAVDLTLEDWNAVMTLNATAIFELSRSFARCLMAEKRGGRVVNIASLMTAAARPGTSPYTASKGAVGQLTRCSRWSGRSTAFWSTRSLRATSTRISTKPPWRIRRLIPGSKADAHWAAGERRQTLPGLWSSWPVPPPAL